MTNSSDPAFAQPDEDELSPDAVDDEDTSAGAHQHKPWNPTKIRITTKNFSLREVVEQIRDGEVDLSPEFQRDYVWKRRQRTRLIESILLGIPLPVFYFNQDDDGTFQVVDGVQRLSTISRFMDDQHELDKVDLEYLQDLHGLRYTGLDLASLRRFKTAQIVVHVIEPQTPDEVKYDIFGRVNTLGSPLSAQEIRHAMSKDRSRKFLKALCEVPSFDEATGMNFWRRDPEQPGVSTPDSGRMMNRELALRFCAFKDFTADEYRRYPSLDSYLVEYTKRIDGRSESGLMFSDEELERIKLDFERAMENAFAILGKNAFRRQWPRQTKRSPINRAVFESQAVALAGYDLKDLLPHKNAIADKFRALFGDEAYSRAVTVGTGDLRRVETRLTATATLLKGLVG
ncbi:DUF262 domain-containing protein [Cupriavidus necator]|uniref:DUF262 domain-containing protein n=1 Tax=Cupriavidus necator TaxID=106590 RepID=A0A1U9UV50_CUPNE|nr:DUF262 domain-containing protein [Cupriavidus necator]AQV96566.1 DUF262 domain-containing protein [Cupriavidus necator]